MSAQGYVSAGIVLQSKKRSGMSAKFTSLGQLQPNLAMLVGQLPMLAYQVMIQVGTCVVHALQKS
jgi:hypothetical protein